MYTSLPFIAALSTLYCATTSALPQTSTTGVFVTRRQTSSIPSATADAERYFHNCKGFLEKQKEAWDDANTLAKAALTWQVGTNFQPDADLWMGKDSVTPAFNTRISTNLKNAVAVHARNWIWPDSSIDVWCNENGPDGLPPPPDEGKLPWFGACDNSSYAYSYIRKHAYWFHTGYTIVFCPRFWHDTRDRFGFINSGKRGLSDVLAFAKKFPVRFGGDPSLLNNLAAVYCSELGFVPLTPILIIDMTEADLSPANPTAKISVEFSYHKSDSGLPCGLGCLDTFTNLTQTCQFDNTIAGSVNVTMGCGTFGFTVLPAI